MKSYHTLFDENPLRIVSRRSQLAMVQTDMVTNLLPDISYQVTGISTSGDEVLDRPLVEIGGKGVFIKALEAEMISGRADCAVHSLKDMETILAPDTELIAYLPREDRRDALVGPYETLSDLPQNSVIGTSSVRRAAMLLHHRPDLKITLLRGNVQRRLAQLEDGTYDAIILAMAGLKRLGLADLGHPLDEAVMLPSASQGVIAIQIATKDKARADAMRAVFAPLNCAKTALAVSAERALLDQLDGSCRTPIGVTADLIDDAQMRLRASLLNADGSARFDATTICQHNEAEIAGRALADDLLAQCGGSDFLA